MSSPSLTGRIIVTLFALLYAAGAVFSSWNIITHTQASTDAIEQILKTYSLKNEGAKSLENYSKEHPLVGMLFSAPIEHAFKLSTPEEADKALSTDVRHFLKSVREESFIAAWWSWFLVSLSALYVVMVIAMERSFATRAVFFALTCVSVTFFVVGILAPAMVIWTAPSIAMESGTFNFVVQHQVRGIAAIIRELFSAGHWIVGGFLLLFSIITPLTKASLTFFVTASRSRALNFRIGQFLHTIGKWSMADVFVAAILLALYALKFQEATKSVPCLGLYYFIGYCLLSLSTTELLVRSGVADGDKQEKAQKKFGPGVLGGLFAGLLFFIAGSSLYTYQQYTANTRQRVTAESMPQKLNNADLVLPAHK